MILQTPRPRPPHRQTPATTMTSPEQITPDDPAGEGNRCVADGPGVHAVRGWPEQFRRLGSDLRSRPASGLRQGSRRRTSPGSGPASKPGGHRGRHGKTRDAIRPPTKPGGQSVLPARSADWTAGEGLRPGRQHQHRPHLRRRRTIRHGLLHDLRLLPKARRRKRRRRPRLVPLATPRLRRRTHRQHRPPPPAGTPSDQRLPVPNPAPYPQPDPFGNSYDPDPTSVEKPREIQSKTTYLLRPSRLCAAPLCYDTQPSPGRRP